MKYTDPLWFTPVFLLFIIAFVEGMHGMAHLHQKLDVHGHCKVYNMKNPPSYDDDW
jgi:hypothetical protein